MVKDKIAGLTLQRIFRKNNPAVFFSLCTLFLRKFMLEEVPSTFHTGFVALVGLTNAGKSTLLNFLVEEKLAIISTKPQTTRKSMKGIRTEASTQMIFIDTPGLHHPQKLYQFSMLEETKQAIKESDCIVYLSPAEKTDLQLEEKFLTQIQKMPKPKILLLTKRDLCSKEDLLAKGEGLKKICSFDAVFLISAKLNQGIEDFLKKIREILPPSPFLYSPEDYTDENQRSIAAEFLRETVLENCHQEIPYGVATQIDHFEEGKNLTRIAATIFVEKPSHQKIVIGKEGKMAKKIGTQTRLKLEDFLHQKVFLEIRVKVLKDWTNDPSKFKPLAKENISGWV